jgi:hypothetical protein
MIATVQTDVKRIKLYEVWDKKTTDVFYNYSWLLTVSSRSPQMAVRDEGFPFSFLRLNDDPLCPYGIPDCFMFEPQVIELMKIRAAAIDHIKRYNRQLLVAARTHGPRYERWPSLCKVLQALCLKFAPMVNPSQRHRCSYPVSAVANRYVRGGRSD